MLLSRSLTSWFSYIVSCMGGCLGCCAESTPIIAVDEQSKGLKIQGRNVKKTSISDDFWSASTTNEMDNSGVPSQRSISSISTSNPTLNPQGSGSISNPPEFINHGLLLWNQTRQQWHGNKRTDNQTQQIGEPRLRLYTHKVGLFVLNRGFSSKSAKPQPPSLLISGDLTGGPCNLQEGKSKALMEEEVDDVSSLGEDEEEEGMDISDGSLDSFGFGFVVDDGGDISYAYLLDLWEFFILF